MGEPVHIMVEATVSGAAIGFNFLNHHVVAKAQGPIFNQLAQVH